MPRVLISANAAWNIVNFRASLVRALIADGHEVIAAVPDDGALDRVRALGARTATLPMASRSTSPSADLLLFQRYRRLFRREQPDLYLGWTIKPNTYGSLAAAMAGVPAINNVSGLGTAFIRRNWVTVVARYLYRLGLARSATVFFQNADDRALFVAERLVREEQARLLPGSGIDADRFDPTRFPAAADGRFRFLLVARLIRDKGVVEFVEAARRVKARYPNALFQILGFVDCDNRTAIPRAKLDAWLAEGVVEHLGAAEDVRPALARADCVVLPSYREGASRVLLEAAAMARPAITTDTTGCRDIVRDRVTGLLCRVRDAADLADKMATMLTLPTAARETMGAAARADVMQRFGETVVIERYREAVAQALAGSTGSMVDSGAAPPPDDSSDGGTPTPMTTVRARRC